MLEVNVSDLKNDLETLNLLIEQYDDIRLNLFNQLKESCINWQDANSIEFDNKIYLEKQESDLFLQSLKDKKEVFDYICDKYSEIGKSIKFNLESKDTIIHTIDNCYNKVVDLLSEFDKIDRSFSYPEQYSIQRQRKRILEIKAKLSDIKNEIFKNYKKIADIENKVSVKISKLETIKINSFDYNLV